MFRVSGGLLTPHDVAHQLLNGHLAVEERLMSRLRRGAVGDEVVREGVIRGVLGGADGCGCRCVCHIVG